MENDFVVSEDSVKTTFGATASGGTNPVISSVDLGGASTGIAGDYTITFNAKNDEGSTDSKKATLTTKSAKVVIDPSLG